MDLHLKHILIKFSKKFAPIFAFLPPSKTFSLKLFLPSSLVSPSLAKRSKLTHIQLILLASNKKYYRQKSVKIREIELGFSLTEIFVKKGASNFSLKEKIVKIINRKDLREKNAQNTQHFSKIHKHFSKKFKNFYFEVLASRFFLFRSS